MYVFSTLSTSPPKKKMSIVELQLESTDMSSDAVHQCNQPLPV